MNLVRSSVTFVKAVHNQLGRSKQCHFPYTTTCLKCQIGFWSASVRLTLQHFSFADFKNTHFAKFNLEFFDRITFFWKMSQNSENTWSATDAKDNQQEIVKLVSINLDASFFLSFGICVMPKWSH